MGRAFLREVSFTHWARLPVLSILNLSFPLPPLSFFFSFLPFIFVFDASSGKIHRRDADDDDDDDDDDDAKADPRWRPLD